MLLGPTGASAPPAPSPAAGSDGFCCDVALRQAGGELQARPPRAKLQAGPGRALACVQRDAGNVQVPLRSAGRGLGAWLADMPAYSKWANGAGDRPPDSCTRFWSTSSRPPGLDSRPAVAHHLRATSHSISTHLAAACSASLHAGRPAAPAAQDRPQRTQPSDQLHGSRDQQRQRQQLAAARHAGGGAAAR